VQHEADAPHDVGLARLLELEEVPPQVEVWRYPEVGLAEVDLRRNDGDRIGDKKHHLNPVEVEEAAKEVTDVDPESVLDVHEEDDGFVGPLSGNSSPAAGF
jgi:hypothetical protein